MRIHLSTVNGIEEEGTRALVESLKQNMTLIDLDLSGMLEPP